MVDIQYPTAENRRGKKKKEERKKKEEETTGRKSNGLPITIVRPADQGVLCYWRCESRRRCRLCCS